MVTGEEKGSNEAFSSFAQCNKCFKCVPSADALKDHACELIYVCWECTPVRNMVTEERLETHRIKFHRGMFSGFKCPDCPRKFLTPRKLRKHRKMTHIVRKPYKCHFCDEYFPTDTQVARLHPTLRYFPFYFSLSSLRSSFLPSLLPSFLLSFLPSIFQAALHERIHTGKIKFECNICDFRTNRFVRLHEHKRKEHGYICVICNEKTVEYAELKYHTLENHGGYLSSESQAGKYADLPNNTTVWCFLVVFQFTLKVRVFGFCTRENDVYAGN